MTDRRSTRPRVGLTRAKVLDAALALVDADGLAKLSMRRLGAALGVEAMTLYHYVPNKDALLDGLVERVVELVEWPAPAQGTPWQEWLRALAVDFRAVLLRHPAVVPLVATRPVFEPAGLDAVERALAVLRAAGLTVRQALHALNTVTTFVVGHVLAEVGDTPGHEDAATDPAARLADLDGERYPLLVAALREGAADDHADRFRFALDALVVGFAGVS
ncbi:TetR/AcrR family transcriptional regulator C-terminal domain-containing protein [Solihabitans fulvus]|uniref:TetR/AcrR family transcriptional regulator C-terminal domain-containing protein n=1 Tax=Solihabitans fulvus TaxID=1892852 RepID=UPI001CB7654C|nr:TetR/AcrR family transcriptional regulator C-terminal domain-containing protein [Solihabitans fulvus]